MSYRSQKKIVSIFAAVLLIIAYTVYALGRPAPSLNDLQSWAVAMLVFIGIGAAVTIAVQILFHTMFVAGIAVKEKKHDDKQVERIIKSSMLDDERDKIIGITSANIGYICASFGFAASLLTLVIGFPVLYALHIVFGSFVIGSIIEACVSIYHYEKGGRNG